MLAIPVFRIFYSTTFTVLSVILAALLLITPADAIRQALVNGHLYYVPIIAGVYFLTLVLAILIYASRLYTNRVVLAGIPKAWIPIEKGDVGTAVHRLILENLARSTAIAWDAKPKDLQAHGDSTRTGDVAARTETGRWSTRAGKVRRTMEERGDQHNGNNAAMISISRQKPPWGIVSHPGWSAPSTTDLPNLQYDTVIYELPHLIEAKAVALAPPDLQHVPDAPSTESTAAPPPDARAVALLQRPTTMGLRDYLVHLSSLNVINETGSGAAFLQQYEHARFSRDELTEEQFRALMRSFADVLRTMTPLDPALLDQLHADSDGDDDEGGSMLSTSTDNTGHEEDESSTPTESNQSLASARSKTPSEGTIRTQRPLSLQARASGAGSSPGTPFAQRPVPRMPSATSVVERRPRYLRSQRSATSTASASSVIRLAQPEDRAGLPYTILSGGSQI